MRCSTQGCQICTLQCSKPEFECEKADASRAPRAKAEESRAPRAMLSRNASLATMPPEQNNKYPHRVAISKPHQNLQMVLKEYPFKNRNLQGGKNVIVIMSRNINSPVGIQAGSVARLNPDGERQTIRMEKDYLHTIPIHDTA